MFRDFDISWVRLLIVIHTNSQRPMSTPYNIQIVIAKNILVRVYAIRIGYLEYCYQQISMKDIIVKLSTEVCNINTLIPVDYSRTFFVSFSLSLRGVYLFTVDRRYLGTL